MADPRYRWGSPLEWLQEASEGWNAERLRFELLSLAEKHDSDTLQDEYQGQMDADGYFREVKPA